MSNEIPLAQAAKMMNVTKQALDYHRKKGHITTRKAGRIHLVDPEVLRKELEPYTYKKDKSQKNIDIEKDKLPENSPKNIDVTHPETASNT